MHSLKYNDYISAECAHRPISLAHLKVDSPCIMSEDQNNNDIIVRTNIANLIVIGVMTYFTTVSKFLLEVRE